MNKNSIVGHIIASDGINMVGVKNVVLVKLDEGVKLQLGTGLCMPVEDIFTYDLDDNIIINASNEEGVVIGRAEYTTSENSYYIRYMAADGRAVEAWWDEDALRLASDEGTPTLDDTIHIGSLVDSIKSLTVSEISELKKFIAIAKTD